jgi:alkaline phosphatase D
MTATTAGDSEANVMTETDQYTDDRREFLRKAGTGVAIAGFGSSGVGIAAAETTNNGRGPLGSDPFTLGVASGDPLPDSVVLWTRLAPEPLEADGGMPDRQVPVQWKIATDKKNGKVQHVVQAGTTRARPEHAHSIHVDAQGLDPNTEYYYQFKTSSDRSSIGRTKTAPAPDANTDEVRFAFTSCQNYPAGHYTAYQNLAEEDLDVVFHLGDYIYEGGGQGSLDRGHEPPRETKSLSDYRIRHAQYKTDSSLQAAHGEFPWIVTWDDHEVENDYADENEGGAPPEEFLKRRANAYQAYWEHMPLRMSRMPNGPNLPLYRRFKFGELAEFNVLDTRQYRDDKLSCSDDELVDGYCPSALDPDRTILGDEQEQWLLDGLESSAARWNVLAQQVIFAAKDVDPNPDEVDYMHRNKWDKWNGFKADRDTLLGPMTQDSDLNPVVLTGDIHTNYVYNIKSDFSDTDSEAVGTEFVGTSISSGGDSSGQTTYGDPDEPYEKFQNNDRGYVRCTMTSEECQADFRTVSTVREPNASVSTLASFVTKAGDPGAKRLTPSIDFQVPETYQSGEFSDSSAPFEITATVTNPNGSDAAEVAIEDLDLSVTGLPDDWPITANTATQFDTVSSGDSVTSSWEIVPDSNAGTVTLELNVAYEIDGESYKNTIDKTVRSPRIAYWRFENNNTDSSGNDNPFIALENGAHYDDEVAVEGDYSVRLDSPNGWVHIDGNGSGFLHDSFNERTVSMWVKPDSTTGVQTLYNEGGKVRGISARINDGALQAGVINGGSTETISTPFDQTDWTHIAFVFDTGTLRLYVNGEEAAANEDVGYDTVGSHSDGAQLGATRDDSVWGPETSPFAGYIDATSIYSIALSDEQISTLSNEF